MKKISYIILLFISQNLVAQNYFLISGQGWVNNNSSTISETTNFGQLTEKRKLNSFGVGLSGGMRMENLFGFEAGVGFLNQKWNYSDRTLSTFTNGLESNTFKNIMKMAQVNLGLHRVFQRNNTNFAYAKVAFDINFLKTGSYSNSDSTGIGPKRTYNASTSSSMAFYASPEVGLYLMSTETSEISVFSSYKVGISSPFSMDYTLDGGGDKAAYQIDGKGKGLAFGIKYTYKIKQSDEKKVKEEKPEKEPKVKEEKPEKEPKVKEEKPEKEPKVKEEKPAKELKLDKDGIPKSLDNREIVKSKTIYVESTNLVFKVWDSGKEVDGDTISLNLNGNWIVENRGLKRDKEELSATITMDGKNFLMLYAINLGKYPPNTAAVSVWDGVTEQILELKSDLKSCGTLNIVYRPK